MECKVGEGWECIICTDKAPTEDGDDTEVSKILEIGDVPVETPTCHHVFHHSCLYKWIIGNQDSHHRCPMCRTELFNAAADQEYLMAMRFVPDHNDEDMEGDDAEDTDPEDTDNNSDDNSVLMPEARTSTMAPSKQALISRWTSTTIRMRDLTYQMMR